MRRWIARLIAATALAGLASGQALADQRREWMDPAAAEAALAMAEPDSAEAMLLAGLLAAFSLNEAEAEANLAPLVAGRRTPADLRGAAASTLGGVWLRQGRYADAASAFETALAMGEDDADARRGLEQSLAISRALANVARPSNAGEAEGAVALQRDMAGLARAGVAINGVDVEMVVDTGANFSVLTESQAQAHGLRILNTPVTVGSTTSEAAEARLGVAETLMLGGMRFRDVVFLVMPDEALTFANGAYRIDGILGFPVLSRLQRLTFETGPGGERMAWRPSDGPAPSRDLFVAGLTPYVYLGLEGELATFALDTGANTTSLRHEAVERHPHLLDQARPATVTFGGAGGETQVQGWTLSTLELRTDDTSMVLPEISVSEEAGGRDGVLGRLGRDALAGGFVLDFPAGDFSLVRAEP